MDELKHYAILVGQTFKSIVMDSFHIHSSSWPVKIYFCVLHVLLLSLALYMFLYIRKKKNEARSLQRKATRTFKRGNKAVTSETCEWLNSVLTWCYLKSTSSAKNTPELLKMWIKNMNRGLYKKRSNNQRIFITNIRPNCLPPKLTSVYCLSIAGTMKCVTFHVESSDFGFHVHVNQPSSNGRSMNAILEVNVMKLSGEVALQMNDDPFEVKIHFIGEPVIKLSTRAITKEGIDPETAGAVEEKLKEVICKTVTTVPLSESNKTENESGSGSLKDKLDSPILQTCVGEEGKLLVKVIKATGLCAKDTSANLSPYCIISVDNPYQRKRTSLMKDTDSPFWNEYFAFDINSKTREITLNIFDFDKTPANVNYHMEDNELSAEQDDFLGQAIVPLATVNRNRTCRLILPVLPKTNKCDYVKGELSLEFTFDKDGKVIDGALPLVDLTDSKAKPTAVEETVYDVTVDKTEAVPSVNKTPPSDSKKNYGGAYAYSLDKSYMETSLDELAQEIEAYEAQSEPDTANANEEKSVKILMAMKTNEQCEQDNADIMKEVAALDATLGEPISRKGEDIEDNKPQRIEVAQEIEQEPEKQQEKEEHQPEKEEEKQPENEEEKEPEKEQEQKEETTPKVKPKPKKSLFKRRPKSTVDADKKTEKDADTSRHSYHAGDEQKKDEETPEKEHKEGEGEQPKTEGEEQADLQPKSKMRRSFNIKFKRAKKDDKDKEISSTQELEPPVQPKEESKVDKELDSVEESLKSDPPKSRFGRFKRNKDHKDKEPKIEEEKEEKKEAEKTDEKKEEKPEEKKEDEKKEEEKEVKKEEEEKAEEKTPLETVDENEEASTSDKPADQPKPKMRKLKFQRGNKRPVSMSAADVKPILTTEEEAKLERADPVRHSYHAGDLPETSQLRKSNSESSLLSYSPNPFSSLVIEVADRGEKKYYHIPLAMEKRGTFEQKGNKYHVYNDHMFRAVHFDASTNCTVCSNSISGLFGKQGYQCKGCKMACHKKCHFQTSDMCSNPITKTLNIIKAPTIVGN